MSKNNPPGIQPASYITLHGEERTGTAGDIIEEILACISVNGKELASFMCSPFGLDHLAAGFLYNEGLLSSRDEIASLHISESNCVDIWLNHEFTLPDRKIVTTGCGGGVTFDDFSSRHPPLQSSFKVRADALTERMKEMHQGAERYQQARGIHTAALATAEKLIFQVEDIGRHNCLDKIAGRTLLEGGSLPYTSEYMLFTSGRVSSEMLNKARHLGIAIVCSRTSPTSLSIALATAWNITVVGYLRGRQMRIYTHPERVL